VRNGGDKGVTLAKTYYQHAIDLVADEMEKLKAEDFDARRWKLIAVLRNAANAEPFTPATSAPTVEQIKALPTRRLRAGGNRNYPQFEVYVRLDAVLALYATDTRQPQTEPGWQPIETAPKDGTWVLAHRADWTLPENVQWHQGVNRGYWQTMDNGWVSASQQKTCGPTHWMPLPPAPRDGE
jgi:hypothetical protein